MPQHQPNIYCKLMVHHTLQTYLTHYNCMLGRTVKAHLTPFLYLLIQRYLPSYFIEIRNFCSQEEDLYKFDSKKWKKNKFILSLLGKKINFPWWEAVFGRNNNSLRENFKPVAYIGLISKRLQQSNFPFKQSYSYTSIITMS